MSKINLNPKSIAATYERPSNSSKLVKNHPLATAQKSSREYRIQNLLFCFIFCCKTLLFMQQRNKTFCSSDFCLLFFNSLNRIIPTTSLLSLPTPRKNLPLRILLKVIPLAFWGFTSLTEKKLFPLLDKNAFLFIFPSSPREIEHKATILSNLLA